MEKIQDWVYEISDILFGIFILVIVISISSHQLYGWFNIGNPLDLRGSIGQSKTSITLENNQDNAVSNPVVSVETLDSPSSSEKNPEPEDSLEVEESVIRNISIAPGSNSQSIANALYENNLIDSTNDFLDKLQSMGLERNIKAGKFEIPQNSTLEDIILLITK